MPTAPSMSHTAVRPRNPGGSPAALQYVAVSLISTSVLAAFLTACSTTAMEAIPLWDQERVDETGSAKDRINVWPLLYCRESALSVLWPLFSATEKGNALVPIYEHRNEEKSLRIVYVAQIGPALFDTKSHVNDDGSVYSRHRVLYRVFYREREGDRLAVDMFPFVAYDEDEDLYRFSFVAGLFGFGRKGDERHVKFLWIPIRY